MFEGANAPHKPTLTYAIVVVVVVVIAYHFLAHRR